MADHVEAIATPTRATAAIEHQEHVPAQHGPTPPSPKVKPEPAADEDVSMNDAGPPPSPGKRLRSPNDEGAETADGEGRDEKRLKMEESFFDGDAGDMDAFVRLIQEAEASIMQDITDDHLPENLHHDSFHQDSIHSEQIRHDGLHHDHIHHEDFDHDHLHAMTDPLPVGHHHDLHIDGIDDDPDDLHNHSLRPTSPALDMPDSPSTMLPSKPPESIWSNPTHFARRKYILPTLGSLAVDVIVTWCEQSLEDTIGTLRNDPESETTKEYTELKNIFDKQRALVQSQHVLLDADNQGVTGTGREIIRIANLATACTSLFSTNEVEWEDLNEHFLRIFVPEGQELPQDTADILLGLKTQMFMAMLESEQGKARHHVLHEIFVDGLRAGLQAHHPHFPLTGNEIQFLASAEARKDMLLHESANADGIETLGSQFSYVAFLDSLNAYLNEHMDDIRHSGTASVDLVTTIDFGDLDHGHDNSWDEFDLDEAIARATHSVMESANETPDMMDNDHASLLDDIRRAAEKATQDTGLPDLAAPEETVPTSATPHAPHTEPIHQAPTQSQPASQQPPAAHQASSQGQQAQNPQQQGNHVPQQQSHSQIQQPSAHQLQKLPQPHPQQPQSQQPPSQHPRQQQLPQQHQQVQGQQQHQSHNGFVYAQQQPAHNVQTGQQTSSNRLPPNQSDSTPALYEKARQAAAARSSTQARREGTHSTRRPWTPEEEKALMMGLDLVKGPHWSQILGLFGPSGSISMILADRTQVQLKDKARNLKLFFLKANTEMPYYLQCVTGELKTRAPTQAARKEAEEKAKSEEQQAHVNGVMTLAGGLQNNHSSKPNALGMQPRNGPAPPKPSNTPTPQMAHGLPTNTTPASTSMPGPNARPAMLAAQPVHLPQKITAAAQLQQKQQAAQQQQLLQQQHASTAMTPTPAAGTRDNSHQSSSEKMRLLYQASREHSLTSEQLSRQQNAERRTSQQALTPGSQPPTSLQPSIATQETCQPSVAAHSTPTNHGLTEEDIALLGLQATMSQHTTPKEDAAPSKSSSSLNPGTPAQKPEDGASGHKNSLETPHDASDPLLGDLRAALERETANAGVEELRSTIESEPRFQNDRMKSEPLADFDLGRSTDPTIDLEDPLEGLQAAFAREHGGTSLSDTHIEPDDDPLKDLKDALERERAALERETANAGDSNLQV